MTISLSEPFGIIESDILLKTKCLDSLCLSERTNNWMTKAEQKSGLSIIANIFFGYSWIRWSSHNVTYLRWDQKNTGHTLLLFLLFSLKARFVYPLTAGAWRSSLIDHAFKVIGCHRAHQQVRRKDFLISWLLKHQRDNSFEKRERRERTAPLNSIISFDLVRVTEFGNSDQYYNKPHCIKGSEFSEKKRR